MMTQPPNHGTDSSTAHRGASVGRRALLAGVGGALATGLAGCSALTQQSFEAAAVILPEADRQELWLAETARDSQTIERSGPGGSEIEITNKATVYSRAEWLEGE